MPRAYEGKTKTKRNLVAAHGRSPLPHQRPDFGRLCDDTFSFSSNGFCFMHLDERWIEVGLLAEDATVQYLQALYHTNPCFLNPAILKCRSSIPPCYASPGQGANKFAHSKNFWSACGLPPLCFCVLVACKQWLSFTRPKQRWIRSEAIG